MQTESGLDWLSRAADLRVCPLCVAAREFENEYLHDFCQSLADHGQRIASFVRAPGFCLDHATKLEQAVLDGEASLSDALELYLRVLESVVIQLAELEQDGWLQTGECPVCASRDRRIIVAAQTLVAAVEHVPWAVGETLRAGGLCIGHFVLAWVDSDESANRELLRDIQSHATVNLIQHLGEVRVDRFSGDPDRQQEAITVWKRAARSVSGWTG